LYGDASTLAEDTLSVLVGDQDMGRKLVQKALMPIATHGKRMTNAWQTWQTHGKHIAWRFLHTVGEGPANC